jgi:hypothetical protein
MPEVLVQFDEPKRAADGRLFVAQVCGQRLPLGIWEAWIEFSPLDGGDPVSTGPATEQLTRGDLRFWAAGLTRKYLDDALVKALSPQAIWPRRAPLPPFELPDDLADGEHMVLETNAIHRPRPVVDPFAAYARGEYALRQELRVLDAAHLRDVIIAYNLPEVDTSIMARTFEDALVERIVAGVQQSVGVRPTLRNDRMDAPCE